MFKAVKLEHGISQVIVRASAPGEVCEVVFEVIWKMVFQYLVHELLDPDAVVIQGRRKLLEPRL